MALAEVGPFSKKTKHKKFSTFYLILFKSWQFLYIEGIFSKSV